MVGPVHPWPPHCCQWSAPVWLPPAAEVVLVELVVMGLVVELLMGLAVLELTGSLVVEEEPPAGGLTTEPASKVELMGPNLMLE